MSEASRGAGVAAGAGGGGPASPLSAGSTTATTTTSAGTGFEQQAAAPPPSTATSASASDLASRTRSRLSGLRELGLEAFKRSRHERDKSGGSSSTGGLKSAPLGGPRSPDASRSSPPYSRTSTQDEVPRNTSATTAGEAGSSSPATPATPSHKASSAPSPPLPLTTSAPALSTSSAIRPMQAAPLPARKAATFVLVTQDHESLSKVDLAGLPSPAAIRERLLARAHVPDDDFGHCTVHMSSLDQEPGSALDDGELWQIAQGVLSGEIAPAPLFFVQLNPALALAHPHPPHSSSSSSSADSIARQQSSQPQSSPPLYHAGNQHPHPPPLRVPDDTPRSSTSSRPESVQDASSTSSISGPRRPLQHHHQSQQHFQQQQQHQQQKQPQPQSQPQRLSKPASPQMRSAHHHHEGPDPSGSARIPHYSPPHQLQHQPSAPFQGYFDSGDRRSSAGSAGDRLHPLHAEGGRWDRRSSAESDNGLGRDRDWVEVERPGSSLQHGHGQGQPQGQQGQGHSRRSDRQARSEAAPAMRSPWENIPNIGSDGRAAPPQMPSSLGMHGRSPTDIRPVGVGPSGPIYGRSPGQGQMHAQGQNNRPRAHSASMGSDGPQNGPTFAGSPYSSNLPPQHPASRNRPPPIQMGPSGPLHFPQPNHHSQQGGLQMQGPSRIPYPPPPQHPSNPNAVRSPPSSSSPAVHDQSYPQSLQPGSLDPPTMRRAAAKSMDNLRSAGSHPPSAAHGAGMPSPRNAGYLQGASNPMQQQQHGAGGRPFQPPPVVYEDPRYTPAQHQGYSQPMRAGASDAGIGIGIGLGRPTSAAFPGRTPSSTSGSAAQSPGMHPQHQLSPPINSNPHARMPPTNNGPRTPSYPPYQGGGNAFSPEYAHLEPQQSRPMSLSPGMSPGEWSPRHQQQQQHHNYQQQQGHDFRPHVQHARTVPGPGMRPDRRPSSDYIPQSHGQRAPSTIQTIAGPSRIPLQPGETLQDMLRQDQHQQHQHQQQQHSSEHMGARQHSAHDTNKPRNAARGFSYEEWNRPSSIPLPSGRHSGPPLPPRGLAQFADDAPFTTSPPASHPEQVPPPLSYSNQSSQQQYAPRSSPQHRISSTSSSHSSAEHPPSRSPVSSRPSTSSGAPYSDKAAVPAFAPADRPQSYSSNSTNELQTPVSERGNSATRSPELQRKSPLLAQQPPEIVDLDDVYEGVEILRENIDAATEPEPEPEAGANFSAKAEPSPYWLELDPESEESETLKAKEWANLFVSLSEKELGSATGEGGDTLGKKSIDEGKKAAASTTKHDDKDEDDESSTLGKDDPRRNTPTSAKPQDPKSTSLSAEARPAFAASEQAQIKAPAPAFHYDPDEDDEDDVMTWAVQMQPTKPALPAVTSAEPASSVAVEVSAKGALGQVTAPDGRISEDDSVLSSSGPRDRPSLRVQTNVNSTPSSVGNRAVLQGVIGSGSASKRTPSPRSAQMRSRQVGGIVEDSLHPSSRRNPSAAAPATSKEESTKMERRASFNHNAWAYRPPVEQVYENLEDFFPGHDLDKPIIDAGLSGPGSAISSPSSEQAPFPSPSTGVPRPVDHPAAVSPVVQASAPVQAPLVPQPQTEPTSRRFNQNRKSIRMVAADKKFRMKKEETAARAAAAKSGAVEKAEKDKLAEKLARRKSTKVWGRKIEEVTPAEAALASAKESPANERGELAPIRWAKGELIGKGTYGHVYIALNVTNGEMIAVKQVELPRTESDKDDNRQLSVIEALKSEMDLLKDLEHEKIVSYLGFDETPSHLSILLEYVPGGSVGRCLRKHGRFEEQVVQFFTTQILEGLEYLHSRGILHRDLKADNILVKMDGTIKISDFGISKKGGSGGSDIYNNMTNMSMQGSIFWMAPEVVHNSRKGYSAKIDIWSLGCVVLEMFAGRRPWDSEEAIQAMFKLGAERLAPPVPKDVVLSNQSAHFLKECFHGDPVKRPVASRLLCHKFLTIDPTWEFKMSALYRAMSA